MLYVKFKYYPTYQEQLDSGTWEHHENMIVWFLFSNEQIEDITHIFYVYE